MTSWQDACKVKKASQAELIPKEWRLSIPVEQNNVTDLPRTCGILTPAELEITELDNFDELVQNLARGKWSAYDVTLAYCKRAAIAHQATNCLTEMFFDKALQQAKDLDETFKTTGKTVGPLHGVPISLKDQIQVEGVECTMAFASWIGVISKEDAVITRILRNAGAVLYVKTNIPQTLMRGETDNWVFGLTTNPFNRALSSGGSSGGEGALIGMKGSPLGVGSDIGGSIRIPAAFNGIYGLRPTMRRVPYLGSMNYRMGAEAIESVLGPISSSLSGVRAFTQALFQSEPWNLDPTCIDIPWRENMYTLENLYSKSKSGKKLAFGIMKWNTLIMPHPPIQRALDMVADALKTAGHEVYEWTPVDPNTVMPLTNNLYASDGLDDFKSVTEKTGETLHSGLPNTENRKVSVFESWQLNRQRDVYRKKMLDKWMETATKTGTGRPIDGIISPVAPHTAPVHGTFNHYWYSMIYNLLDYPTCTFPVSTVDPHLDPIDSSYKPVNASDEENWKRYSPETYKDAPVSLQLCGRRFREEEVLGMVKVITDVLNTNLDHK